VILSDRALNRATLARQLLVERVVLDVGTAVDALVGLQAQNPHDPYLALWSRLRGFDPTDLSSRIEGRSLVRMVVIRGTIHLVSVADGFGLRPLMQGVLDRELRNHSEYGPLLRDVDLAPVLAFAEPLLASTPLTAPALRAAMEERFPELPAAALAYACRCLLPLVQVPPRGLWGRGGAVRSTTLAAWAGGGAAGDGPAVVDDVVLRYLAAFGPATPADFATWSRLQAVRPVFERLRPQLVSLRDERGRELFDVPDGPRPGPDVDAPVRFLPEYDNVLLSHADRSRFGPEMGKRVVGPRQAYQGAVLVDGGLAAVWREPKQPGGPLVVHPLRPLSVRERKAVDAEGEAAAAFWAKRVAGR
jgi:hypothetical protein